MQDKVLCYSARILKLYCKDNQICSNGIESWNVKNKHEFGGIKILMPRSMPLIVFKEVLVSAWAKTYQKNCGQCC
jgi:hypothetical protein